VLPQASVAALKQQLQEHLASVQQQVQQQDVLLSGVQQHQGEVAGGNMLNTRLDLACAVCLGSCKTLKVSIHKWSSQDALHLCIAVVVLEVPVLMLGAYPKRHRTIVDRSPPLLSPGAADSLSGRMDQQTRRESALTQRFDSLLAKVNNVNNGLMDRCGI
jgi:hypothetical protein